MFFCCSFRCLNLNNIYRDDFRHCTYNYYHIAMTSDLYMQIYIFDSIFLYVHNYIYMYIFTTCSLYILGPTLASVISCLASMEHRIDRGEKSLWSHICWKMLIILFRMAKNDHKFLETCRYSYMLWWQWMIYICIAFCHLFPQLNSLIPFGAA